MIFSLRDPVTGEILIAWQGYNASSSDELTLKEGDVVELLDTKDPVSSAKRIKLDPDLDAVSADLLDNSAARHKLSVKPKRRHASSRHSPTRLNINQRWLVREVSGSRRQGWVPCKILQTADDPALSTTGLPGDAEFRRQAVIKELVETEQEFVRDLDQVVRNYLIPTESGKVPKVIKDNFDVVFGNLKEIAEFHRTVLMEGVKYYAKEPLLLGKTFLRLERDFDKHVHYCRDEPLAQEFLDTCDEAYDYFSELSQRLGDDKTISEHLKLPIQRINDYQLLLKELVRYSACLSENNTDLQKALDLMLSVPHRAQDDKFTSSIEGYRGSIHKLGRLLAHDRFSITFGDITKERYLFLFKARILICKVRRISEDRSIFQLKEAVRLTQVELKDHPDDDHAFELVDKVSGQSLILKVHRNVKQFWLKEIREFSNDYGETDETVSDEFVSPPSESSQTNQEVDSLTAEKQPSAPQKPVEPTKVEPPVIQVKKPDESPKKQLETAPPNSSKPDKPISVKPKLPGQTKEQDKLIQELKSAVTKSKETEKTKEEELTTEVTSKKAEAQTKEQEQLIKELKAAVTKTEVVNKKVELQQKEKLQVTTATTTETSSRTVVPQLRPSLATTTTTTTDLPPSDSETLKQIQTPESETVEEHHLHRIQEVEPLVQINKPRVLEEVIPYVIKPPPEAVPGSAIEKLYSVEKSGVSEVVLTDFKVGVEVNVEVGDDMSRRYTSSARSG